MDEVDELMGMASEACEGVFGRPVTYTPPGGSSISCTGIFYRNHELLSYQGGVEVSSLVPAVDIRDSELGVDPEQDAVVTVAGGTYRVLDVQPRSQQGSHLLILGRRQ